MILIDFERRTRTSANKNAKRSKAPAKAKKKKPESLVIGKNLKVEMPLSEAIKLLGIPGSMKTKRGTESKLDSISIEYANHGIVIHSLNGKRQIEALGILPTFAGSFAEGVKMGAKIPAMIDKYGVSQSMNDSLAKYPKRGMYFSLKENVLVLAHVFAKNSKLSAINSTKAANGPRPAATSTIFLLLATRLSAQRAICPLPSAARRRGRRWRRGLVQRF